MDNVIEIKNLTKTYDKFKLNDINLSVIQGTVMGIIGENGAGKTTLIKLMLNMIKRDSGTVKIFGLDAVKDEKKIKEQIGVVMDESFFSDHIMPNDIPKVMKNIIKHWDEKLFDQYMDKFELPQKKSIKDYSKGMKAKLRIATAMSHNPRMLILDEATSSLDPIARNEMLDIFRDYMQNEEHTIIMASHITGDLEKNADYITFINKGNMVFSEPKDDLLVNYGILKCGLNEVNLIDKEDICGLRKNSFGCEILVNNKEYAHRRYSGFVMDNVTIEEIMLFKVRGERL